MSVVDPRSDLSYETQYEIDVNYKETATIITLIII